MVRQQSPVAALALGPTHRTQNGRSGPSCQKVASMVRQQSPIHIRGLGISDSTQYSKAANHMCLVVMCLPPFNSISHSLLQIQELDNAVRLAVVKVGQQDAASQSRLHLQQHNITS